MKLLYDPIFVVDFYYNLVDFFYWVFVYVIVVSIFFNFIVSIIQINLLLKIPYLMDTRLQAFKYVGAGLATISLAAQVLELGVVFGAYLSAYSKEPYNGKGIY